jgi:hypothetical protein
MASNPNQLQDALNALQKLLDMFKVERVIYLVGALISLGLLVFATLDMIEHNKIGPKEYVLLFGSGGLFAVAGAQVTFFLRKGMQLVIDLTLKLAVAQAAAPAPPPAAQAASDEKP